MCDGVPRPLSVTACRGSGSVTRSGERGARDTGYGGWLRAIVRAISRIKWARGDGGGQKNYGRPWTVHSSRAENSHWQHDFDEIKTPSESPGGGAGTAGTERLTVRARARQGCSRTRAVTGDRGTRRVTSLFPGKEGAGKIQSRRGLGKPDFNLTNGHRVCVCVWAYPPSPSASRFETWYYFFVF